MTIHFITKDNQPAEPVEMVVENKYSRRTVDERLASIAQPFEHMWSNRDPNKRGGLTIIDPQIITIPNGKLGAFIRDFPQGLLIGTSHVSNNLKDSQVFGFFCAGKESKSLFANTQNTALYDYKKAYASIPPDQDLLVQQTLDLYSNNGIEVKNYQHFGVATFMLDLMVLSARQSNFSSITMYGTNDNSDGLYEHSGYPLSHKLVDEEGITRYTLST